MVHDFSDELIEGELVRPRSAWLGAPVGLAALPEVGRGPGDLERRRVWVERKSLRRAPAGKVELMLDMARRLDRAAIAAFEEADADWEREFEAGGAPELDLAAAEALEEEARSWIERSIAACGTCGARPELLVRLAYRTFLVGRGAEAADIAGRVLDEFPDAPQAPLAALLVGEHQFGQAHLLPAQEAYERAATSPDPQLAVYATYKLAWVHFNLQQVREAWACIEEVARHAEDGDAPWARFVADEAIKDAVIFAAQLPLDEAIDELGAICPTGHPTCQEQVRTRFEVLLEAQGRLDDSRHVHATWPRPSP